MCLTNPRNNTMKTIAALILLSIITTGAHAGGYTLQAHSLACFSEDSYRNQIAMISQGHDRLLSDCGITQKANAVVVLDLDTLTERVSRVMTVNSGVELWVSSERLDAAE
jgi:hypothetical protein